MTPRYSTRVLTYAVETQNAVLKRYRILRKDARAVLNVRRNQELNRSHRSLKAPAEGGFYFAYYPRRCSFRAVATRARWDASSRNLFKCQARPAEGGFYFAYYPRRCSFHAVATRARWDASSRNLFKCQARPAEGGFYFAYYPRRCSFRAVATRARIEKTVDFNAEYCSLICGVLIGSRSDGRSPRGRIQRNQKDSI